MTLLPRVLDWRMSVLALVLTATALAQDVSISPLRWTDPKDPPDEMPALQTKPRLDFPAALRTTPDIGYIVLSVILDPKGNRLGAPRAATTRVFERVYDEAYDKFRFTPGRRDGKPVNSAVTFALIFNPASAAVDKPDATPRLLDVTTVHVPRPRGARSTDSFEDQVVFATVSVDESGKIAAIKDVPPAIASRFEIAAKNWLFAPARQAGKPVAAEVRVPVVIVTGDGGNAAKGVAPRVTFQKKPIYPFVMRASGMRGEVVVDFIVDIEGRVRNAFVVRTLNPAFDDPALEAVRKWKFEPGHVGDRPVNTHMQVPVIFQLDDTPGHGSDGLDVVRKADLSKLPEELRYDTPPKLIGSARPIYPYPLLAAGREGKAAVSYLIDERGRVAQAKVTQASAPEFGQALLAAVQQFVFEPAIKGGRPSRALQGFQQDFNRDERYQVVSDDDLSLLRREQKKPGSIVKLSEIDGKLVPISQPSPRAPLGVNGAAGNALIEFLVDEDGRARLPRIVSASDEAYGYAAMQAIARWHFEPPTRGGQAAIVRVTIPIKFAAAAPTPPEN
jgi:TonB family protein